MNLYETKRKDKAAIKKLNHTLAQNGFAIVPGVLEPADLARLISLLGQADDPTPPAPCVVGLSIARHRRVIHLEFACGALPGGLAWFSENH